MSAFHFDLHTPSVDVCDVQNHHEQIHLRAVSTKFLQAEDILARSAAKYEKINAAIAS
eukprot:SAG31_NODE_2241_length_6110_cov_3.386292_6_plen_58_part_00